MTTTTYTTHSAQELLFYHAPACNGAGWRSPIGAPCSRPVPQGGGRGLAVRRPHVSPTHFPPPPLFGRGATREEEEEERKEDEDEKEEEEDKEEQGVSNNYFPDWV